MNDLAHARTDGGVVPPANDTASFAGIFVVSFVVFLLIALCAQMVALFLLYWVT